MTMKKSYLLLGGLMLSGFSFAQVGVDTETPKTTMDVSAKRNTSGVLIDNSKTFGLQAPRLTRAELTANTATYGTNQNGALVYITDVSAGTQLGQRIKIDAVGYYYFDGSASIWQKLNSDATSIEPWNIENSTLPANSNDKNIYQNSSIGISHRSAGSNTAGYFKTRLVPRALSIVGDGNGSDDFLIQSFTDASASSAQITQNRTRGKVGAVLPVSTSDNIGFVNFGANGSTAVDPSYIQSANITATVGTGTISTSSVPIDLTFNTGTSSTPAERLRITNTGNVGINTASPATKLHIVSTEASKAFQMQDGSEGTGKFLASNSVGQATWVNSPLVPITSSTSDGQQTGLIDVLEDQYVYKKITLTKGRWMIYVGQLFLANNATDTNNYWVRLTLSSDINSNVNAGFSFLSTKLVSGWLSAIGPYNEKYTFLNGVIPVEVTDTSKIIYLRTREFTKTSTSASVTLQTRGNFGENYLFAIPAY